MMVVIVPEEVELLPDFASLFSYVRSLGFLVKPLGFARFLFFLVDLLLRVTRDALLFA